MLSGAATLSRAHPTAIPVHGWVPPLGAGTGEAGLQIARQQFCGWMMFVATWCHICFSKSHTLCPAFVLGSSRLRPCVCTKLYRNLPCPPRPGTAGMLRGDATCQPGDAETFSIGCERGSKGGCNLPSVNAKELRKMLRG